ncbi:MULTISPECIES: hypothetical protein [unclassified Streptomyces]|uniref:hypothetical protein n=1 Tax=unclassified Streptomyces TaxID=2593676 RepID=UPI002256E3DF|nr:MULTISPECIES: hypothetical protein [unclassified Streptomyces]MCX5063777.1 hypothetical protein [Streptomyces sp. NBC_00452]MCX5294165.1 hypothetical protein [Streptomyces sp. NBC_00183]
MSEENDEHQLRRQAEYRSYGLKPGTIAYHFQPEFGLLSLKEALFESPYGNPKTLEIPLTEEPIHVVVTMASPQYLRCDNSDDGSRGIAYYDRPNWYFEGWIVGSGYNPGGTLVRVRVSLACDDTGRFDTGYVQEISENFDPEDPIIVKDTPSLP